LNSTIKMSTNFSRKPLKKRRHLEDVNGRIILK
jgi:hypothetical protein